MSNQGVWMEILRKTTGKIDGCKICGWALPVKQVKANPNTQMLSLQAVYLKCKYYSRGLSLLKPKFEEMTSLRSNFVLQNIDDTWPISLCYGLEAVQSAQSVICFHVLGIHGYIHIVCIAKKSSASSTNNLIVCQVKKNVQNWHKLICLFCRFVCVCSKINHI